MRYLALALIIPAAFVTVSLATAGASGSGETTGADIAGNPVNSADIRRGTIRLRHLRSPLRKLVR